MSNIVLIIGAGLSGAVLAERFANDGAKVIVFDKRNHIGGNIYDYLNEDGLRVGKYGAHIYHDSDEETWEYVNRFSKWKPYEHRVVSNVDGQLVPIPINIDTVNTLLGAKIKTEDDMNRWLELQKSRIDIKNPKNSYESAISRIGNEELYNKMIKFYTFKQWGVYPEKLEASVLDRIPVRNNYYNRYFSDKYEAIPENGYTKLVENMLNHKNITVYLGIDYHKGKDLEIFEKVDKIFFTGKIDTYFNNKYGKLEYRSLRFEHETHDTESYQPAAVVNYPGMEVPFTRIVEHKKLYGQTHHKTLVTKEYSQNEGEPYYPFPNKKNRKIYEKYQKEAQKLEKNGIYFVGRLASYKYINMNQAVKMALDLHRRIKDGLG